MRHLARQNEKAAPGVKGAARGSSKQVLRYLAQVGVKPGFLKRSQHGIHLVDWNRV
jgi:hypothetical protein